MLTIVLRYLNLVALLLATGWLTHDRSWGPAIAFVVALGTFIAGDAYLHQKQHKENSEQGVVNQPRHDEVLFRNFLKTLPSKGSISFIDENNMAGFSFPLKALDQLKAFVYDWDDAEHQFNDPKLEELRARLVQFSDEYLSFLSVNTWPTERGYQTVPPEWETDQPERFYKVVKKLHDSAGEIVSVHQELVSIGRQMFGVANAAQQGASADRPTASQSVGG